MYLVEIAKGVSINPEKVIAVKLVDKLERVKDLTGNYNLRTVGKKVVVVVEELIGEYSEQVSLRYSAEYDSDFSYALTIERLTDDTSTKGE